MNSKDANDKKPNKHWQENKIVEHFSAQRKSRDFIRSYLRGWNQAGAAR